MYKTLSPAAKLRAGTKVLFWFLWFLIAVHFQQTPDCKLKHENKRTIQIASCHHFFSREVELEAQQSQQSTNKLRAIIHWNERRKNIEKLFSDKVHILVRTWSVFVYWYVFMLFMLAGTWSVYQMDTVWMWIEKLPWKSIKRPHAREYSSSVVLAVEK